jgi:hypothetical protein
MKFNFITIFILSFSCAFSQKALFETNFEYTSSKDVSLDNKKKRTLDSLSNIIKSDTAYLYDIILLNKYYREYRKSRKIDLCRVDNICSFLKQSGVKEKNLYCKMWSMPNHTVQSQEEIDYYNKLKKTKSDFIYIDKILIVRRVRKLH